MKVEKRNGATEPLNINKIKTRLSKLCHMEPQLIIDLDVVVQKVVQSLYDGISTKEIDDVSAKVCANLLSTSHQILSSRVLVSSHHKQTNASFSQVMEHAKSLLDPHFYSLIMKNKSRLNKMCDYMLDYKFTYFAMSTLLKSYLLKDEHQQVIERPQHMYLRVSLYLYSSLSLERKDIQIDWFNVERSYKALSTHQFTHATPTLFNAGTKNGNLASCYLIGTEDTVEGLYHTVAQCAILSKSCGGIGLHCSNVRGSGSLIKKTNGLSSGIVPWLKVINHTAKHINQGGKRAGSVAIYLEPWHVDVEAFIELRKNTGAEDSRARDLFLALWISDAFMEAVKANDEWYLFSEDTAPNLSDTWGREHEQLLVKYRKEKRYIKQVKARDLWRRILLCQMETGMPYISYKDQMNRGCTQSNLGTLKSSNLCHEITLVSDHDNIQVCVLASISLPAFYVEETCRYDYKGLYDCAYQLCMNLNKVLDTNVYPLNEAEKTAKRDRPIAIGIQGWANLVYSIQTQTIMADSIDLSHLAEAIQAVIYYGALNCSIDLAEKFGSYASFNNSPWSKGLLQFDLLGYQPISIVRLSADEDMKLDWENVRKRLLTVGIYNSTLTALMPTASTSLLLDNFESFELPTSHIMKRQTLAGEFIVANKHLLRELERLYDVDACQLILSEIIEHNGSIQDISELPKDLRSVYLTAFEQDQKDHISLSSIRQKYIDQSQSLNLFLASNDPQKLNELLFYGWKLGLKSGLYYLRTTSISKRDKQSILNVKTSNNTVTDVKDVNNTVKVCPYNPGGPLKDCEACSG